MNLFTIIALVLIFLGGIGAILLVIGQSIASTQDKSEIINTAKAENLKLQNELSEIKKERNELSRILAERDSILQEKNDTIIQLNSKLADKSEYIQNYLTGGSGYPVIEVENFATNDYNDLKGLFKLKSVSKFPLYNLIVNIFDYDLLLNSIKELSKTEKPVVKLDDFNRAKLLSYKIDELPPNQTTYFDKKIKLQESRYYIQIKARNNIYIEKMASIIYDKILFFAYQVSTLDGHIIAQDFGDTKSKEILSKLLEKLNSISNENYFELAE